MTHGSLLAKNTVLNVLGLLAPLLAALVSVPLIIDGVGTDRFGLLTLAWAVVGYFSLFDMGLSRAIIQMISEKLGAGREEDVPELIWTALFAMSCLGIIGGTVGLLVMPQLVNDILKCPEYLRQEALHSFYLIGAAIPFVVIRAGLRGILIAYQRFDLTNWVRIPLGVYTFLIPLPVLLFSNSLFPIVSMMLAGLVVGCLVYFWLCRRTVAHLMDHIAVRKHLIAPLFRFGGWMTVTNIFSPLLVYLDRFFIGALVSLTAVAFYATSHEIVTKMILIPNALTSVLFPAFSASHSTDRQRLTFLFYRSMKYVLLVVFPAILTMVVLAEEGLNFWLGKEFAVNSVSIFQVLSCGIFFNCLALIPFSLIQGAGRPDLTAKLHLVELPLYLVFLWLFIPSWGAFGAAAACTARLIVDTFLLFTLSRRFMTAEDNSYRISILLLIMGALIIVFGTTLLETGTRLIYLTVVLFCFGLAGWLFLIRTDEKQFVWDRLRSFRI